MLFHSLEFMVFLPVVVAGFFLLPHKWRWVWLLVASYVFYANWRWKHLLLILISTGVDYWAAREIGKQTDPARRRLCLYMSLLANLGMLFVFKYFNFFSGELLAFCESLGISYPGPVLHLMLPIGISFYTFQTMSYTLDVYHGRILPEKHLGRFALFVAFFPQLVAGPIERAGNILPQFLREVSFDYNRITGGLKRIAWGFFKKIVIADRLALFVDPIFDQGGEASGLSVLVATIFFAFQIYCDFSAYSDIAIGIAAILGIRLMENFRQPYFSRSVGEFWRRWHISLSTWFRDYVYIPMGGNRVVKWRWYYNLMVVFLISGLWHGANWTFLFWGGLHGIFIITENLSKSSRPGPSVPNPGLETWRVLRTFVFVLITWIFFRADSIGVAFGMLESLFSPGEGWGSLLVTEGRVGEFAWSCFLILFLILADLLEAGKGVEFTMSRLPRWTVWVAYILLIWVVLNLGVYGEREFIYFQF